MAIKSTYVQEVPTIDKNANISFKLGLESTLKSASFQAVNGTFYLTSDTHRLYIGDKDGNVCPVNQGVIPVKSLPDHQNGDVIPGHFYYLTDDNILATFNGTQWVQINPDTEVKYITNTVTAGTNAAVFSTVIDQDGGSHSTVRVNSNTKNGAPNNVTIEGDNEIVVTVKDNKITISDSSYSLGTDDGDPVVIDDVSNNVVKLNLNKLSSAAGATEEVEDTVSLMGVSGVSVSQKDKVITIDASAATSAATLDGIASLAFSNRTGDNKTGFDLTLKRRSGESISTAAQGYLDPVIVYGDKGSESVKFSNGTATLEVYTQDQIDAKMLEAFRTCNALTYKGVVGQGATQTELPDTNVSVGDVWMSNGYYTDQFGTTFAAGTLFIAQGDEDEDGYIDGTIDWAQVENYNTDTRTSVEYGTNSILFYNSILDGAIPGKKTHLGGLKVVAETVADGLVAPINVNESTVDNNKVLTVSHTPMSVDVSEESVVTGAEIHKTVLEQAVVIGDFGVDNWGHVNSINQTLLSVPTEIFSESNTVTDVVVDPDDKAYATLSDTFTLKNARTTATISSIGMSTNIKSDTLKFATDTLNSNTALKIDLVWGSF